MLMGMRVETKHCCVVQSGVITDVHKHRVKIKVDGKDREVWRNMGEVWQEEKYIKQEQD